jgi:hypothetical protein
MSIFYLSFLNIYDFNIAYHRITTENDNNRAHFSTMTAMTTIAFVYGSTFRRKSAGKRLCRACLATTGKLISVQYIFVDQNYLRDIQPNRLMAVQHEVFSKRKNVIGY